MGQKTSETVPSCAGISTPMLYMVPWAHPSLTSNRYLDQLSRFLRDSRTWSTDRLTDRQTYYTIAGHHVTRFWPRTFVQRPNLRYTARNTNPQMQQSKMLPQNLQVERIPPPPLSRFPSSKTSKCSGRKSLDDKWHWFVLPVSHPARSVKSLKKTPSTDHGQRKWPTDLILSPSATQPPSI